MKKIILISAITVIVGIIGFMVVRALQKAAIKKRLEESFKNPDAMTAAGGADKLLASGAFNTHTYQKGGKTTITLLEARERANEVWNAYSWFGSDQSAIVSAFKGLGHIHDVSKISHEFEALHDEVLVEVLKKALTEKSKMSSLTGIINKLPKN